MYLLTSMPRNDSSGRNTRETSAWAISGLLVNRPRQALTRLPLLISISQAGKSAPDAVVKESRLKNED
ncbi:MAG: hypothetical protein MZW92_12965 [Comamonadaceae bacterium]|nr:hypothetical protein [Comamonadaceae bacterium]